MKILLLIISVLSMGSITPKVDEPTMENVLNCQLAIQRFDRVLELYGVCPDGSDPSFVIGYYMGKNNHFAYKVNGSVSRDKHNNKIVEYQVFIKKPNFLRE